MTDILNDAAECWASIKRPDQTKLTPGEYPAKIACVRTFGRREALWLEIAFALKSGDPVEPILAPIAARPESSYRCRLCEGWRLIRALYGAEGRTPPDHLKARHLTHFINMPVIACVAVCQIGGAAIAVVRNFVSPQKEASDEQRS